MPIVNRREARLAHRLKNTQERAQLKSRMCTITYNDLDNLCNNQKGLCALTGYTMSSTRGDPLKVSIDRMASAKGSTLDNRQLVGRSVNRSKSNIDNNEFIAMCKAIASPIKEPK